MSSCDNSNIRKNYIVSGVEQDILSACTGFYTNDIYPCTGDTIIVHSDILSANTINSSVFLSGGTNLLDIFGSMDTNTFVTGMTYDNSNNLSIGRNDGVSFGVNISEFSGLTINGVLSACTGVYTTNIYGCSPITVHDELIFLSGLTLSSISQDNGLTEILARDSGTGEVKYRDVSSIAPAAKLQNTYFVSSLSGDNSTALVGDINNPWKTITEARNQAVVDGYSNSLIHVYSGEYLEDEIQYENGNFYFEPNSKVTTQRTASGGTTSIFRLGQTLVYESNTYSANTCNVYGYGDFSVSATTDTDSFGGFILSMLGDSNSYFEFNDAYVHSGEAFWAGGNSILTLEGHDILLDPSGSDGLDFSDTSTTLINVNDIVGGNSHYNIHYRQSFAGKSVVNFNKLIGSDQLIGFDRFMQPTAEITMNFNLIEHTGGSRYIINSGDNLGAKVTLNGDFYAPYGNGILLYHDAGEYNINGNITCRDTALLSVGVLSPSNDFVLNYNGDIVTSGVTSEPPPLNSNGGIELNKITANLNGSLTNLSLGDLSNGINIDGDSILSIDNFDINVASGNTIGTSSSNVVNIKHSLNINKPMSSGITTTGLFNYTGTTNVGDLVVYNTPTNDNSLTQILGRNSTTGDVEYRDVSSIISAATSQDTFVSGGTYNEGTTSIDFSGNSIETTFSVSLSGISSNIDIYNTYFVSPTGDDSTAVRGDLHNPFKTITAARNKVVSELSASTVTGDTLIHVYPGSYEEEEIQYENGNFYFEPNSIVTMTPTLVANASALFKLGSTPTKVSNIYSATTCNVYGYGIFVVSASTDGSVGGTVLDLESNSVSSFEFDIINIENGLGINSKDVSTLHLEGNDINVDISADCIAMQDGSKHIINVNKVVGGSGHWGFHYSNYSGTSLVNISEILGKPSFQPIGFSDTEDGAEIVVNFNKLSHEPVGTQFVINNSNQKGGKITLNGNIEAQRGIVYGQTCTGGEFNYNGDIIVNEYPILNSFTGPHNGNTFFYNGNIISNGDNGNGSILLKGGTTILNGSLTNNTFTGNTNGVSITSDPTDLKIGNFDINVNTESITSTASQTVEILHSLNVNKPINSNITTTGLFNYTGTTNVGDLVIYNTPTNDNSLTEILGRNSTTGDVEYRDVNSIISAATSADTFVTGFTYDNSNNLTITRNDGVDLTTSINIMSALTVTSLSGVSTIQDDGGELTIISDDFKIKGDGITIQDNGGNDKISIDTTTSTPELSGEISFNDNQNFSSNVFVSNVLTATTISATTYFGDGSNLTGISTDNFYVSGGSYDVGTNNINFSGNNVVTTFDVGLSSLISSVSGDTFVVSGNADVATSQLTFTYNTGGTFTVTNSAALFSDNDINVTGGTYNPSSGCVTFTTNSGTTFDVCGFVTGITDTFTTGSTLVGETIQFDSNILGTNYYNVSLSPVLSGKTDNLTFNSYTSNTETILNSKVSGATNLSTTGLFAQKNGDNLEFKGLTSTGGTVTITNDSTTVNLEVLDTTDTNSFSTGGTVTQSATSGDSEVIVQIVGNSGFTPYNITGLTDTFVNDFSISSNTFTISQNDGSSFVATADTIDLASVLSAVTFDIGTSGSISATTFNGGTFNGTFVGDGSGLTGITDNNTFVTGTTFASNQLTLTRNDNVDIFSLSGGSNVTLSETATNDILIDVSLPSSMNTFVTGGTYNESTDTITLTRNDAATVDITGVTDTFTTGSTYDNGTALATFTKNDGTTYTLDLSTIDVNDTFVTGFTYNNTNTFTISRNDGVDLNTSINTMTGLTVNGDITVTGTSNLNAVTATTIDFDLNYTGETAEGRLSWNFEDATLDLGMGGGNVTQQIGQEIYYIVKNQSGATISNGRVVRNAGSFGASGRILGEYMIADGTYPFAKTLGIATEDILNGEDGLVTEFGVVRGIDTTGSLYGESWSDGDVLYVSPTIPGGLTSVEPSAPNQVLEMGVILNAAANGSIFVDRHLSTRLGDISDIQTTGATNGDLIVYNSATTVWGYSKTLTGDYDINGDLDVTGDTTLGPLTATSVTSNSAINVFNGHINIRDNSFFLQGRTVADANVSLIGVDNQDRVFVGNAGYDTYIDSDTIVDGVLSAQTAFLTTTPTLNNSATDILVRNSSTGEVEYRPVSGITPDTNTFVTGSSVTSNVLELTRNDSQQVLQLSGGTNAQFIDNGNNSITLNVTSGGGGGASVSFPWKFKEPTASSDPGSGHFRLNNTVASAITEVYVSDETNNSIDASNLLNILDVGDVIYIQQNDDATRALLFTVSASTVDNTGWFTIPVQYQQGSTIPKKDKICGWIFASTGAEDNTVSNVGVGQGVFKQRNVDDFEFYSLSGGSNTTLSLNNDTIVIDVSLPPSMDTYVTGGTYSDATDTITLTRNDATNVDITGVTDTFVTGTTFSSNQATVTRNDGTDVLFLTGGTNVTLSNPSTNQIKIDVSSSLSVVSVTGTTYSATTSDDVIGFDTSSVEPTLFLPDSTSSGTKRYEVKDIGVNSRRNPITIQAAGSDTIITTSVVSSFELSADGGAVILVSTGTGQWWQM